MYNLYALSHLNNGTEFYNLHLQGSTYSISFVLWGIRVDLEKLWLNITCQTPRVRCETTIYFWYISSYGNDISLPFCGLRSEFRRNSMLWLFLWNLNVVIFQSFFIPNEVTCPRKKLHWDSSKFLPAKILTLGKKLSQCCFINNFRCPAHKFFLQSYLRFLSLSIKASIPIWRKSL